MSLPAWVCKAPNIEDCGIFQSCDQFFIDEIIFRCLILVLLSHVAVLLYRSRSVIPM
jgi:hypothetical protein